MIKHACLQRSKFKQEYLSIRWGKNWKKIRTIPYAQAMGNLMYAMISTRPDICHAVWLVRKYQSNLGMIHWQAIKRIFRYLYGTKNMRFSVGLSDR